MLSGYKSYVDSAAEDAKSAAAFAAFRECSDKQSAKLEEFWTQVKKQAEEGLESVQARKKQKEEVEAAHATSKQQTQQSANQQ